ncbi:hypothetical protein Poli38472_010983 [Pythium oligandrum]|uniref:Phosphoribosyltransferase domain-containing protein n=1 Tax=Pythium oligandrum TaxID=41045 RepID=A0A8K1FFQ7_PYTOL|nr:hypothetical protein Poli38472_010983 [Pythium oligandrum]|eukprot:TMW61920.1 hypothetical protein Poli38472_010983 [Pythium oligandrum]
MMTIPPAFALDRRANADAPSSLPSFVFAFLRPLSVSQSHYASPTSHENHSVAMHKSPEYYSSPHEHRKPTWSAMVSSPESPRPRFVRTSRYLREVDRRNILERIQNGEKQSDLAKEYQVSRAAISNLKHRHKRKSHSDEAMPYSGHSTPISYRETSPRGAPYPTRPRWSASLTPRSMAASQHSAEIQLPSMTRLLAQLQDHQLPDAKLRLVIDRMTRLLLEEALGRVSNEKPVSAVALDERGEQFLHEFQLIEVSATTGQLQTRHDSEDGSLRAAFVSKPSQLTTSSVLVLDTHCSSSGRELIAAIQTLLHAGVNERDISLVTLFSHKRGLDCVLDAFPNVQCLSAKVLSPSTERWEFLSELQRRLATRSTDL